MDKLKIIIKNMNNRTLINKYRVSPVVNNTVINNYTSIRQRYNFRNANITWAPRETAIKRIHQDQSAANRNPNISNKIIVKDKIIIREKQFHRLLIQKNQRKMFTFNQSIIKMNSRIYGKQ